MKLKKRKNVKYPVKATLSDKTVLIIPRQSKFDNDWLRHHGCSLVAEYIALQWLGVKKWPAHLLKWHKKHTPDEIFAKVTIKGVAEGINKLSKGKAKYYKEVTSERMKKALKDGKIVIYEQKNPIHTVTLIPDDGKIWIANHGSVKKTTVKTQMKKVLTETKYRGMVVVSRNK